jgi:hypothetical protein
MQCRYYIYSLKRLRLGESIYMDNLYNTFCNYVRTITDLHDFKSHPSFTYVLEHVSFEYGSEYLRYIKYLTPFTNEDIINYCNKNDKYGSGIKYDYGIVVTSPTNLRYILHAYLILKHITELGRSRINIAEIGCGYGGLCLAIEHFSKIMNVTIDNYYLVDLPDIINLQKRYLGNFSLSFKTHFHNALQYGSDIENNDLFLVSNYCFSEISDNNQKRYIEQLFPKVSHGFMAWNFIPVYNFGFNYRQEDEYPNTYHDTSVKLNQYVYF